tara:strand:+ start:335 stop:913 length:579 start_codon:yes stop_codon:yes gene_type:complete
MKTLLALLLLIPLNLVSKDILNNYGNWIELITIDDFTDKKSIIVTTEEYETYDNFAIRWSEGKYIEFIVGLKKEGKCEGFIPNTYPMLFRVDKNKLLELPMKKYDEERPYLYGVDFEELLKEGEEIRRNNYIKYIEEIKKGKILRIRVDDKSNGCKKDLAFNLKDFDKAIKNISDEMASFINLAIIEEELNK